MTQQKCSQKHDLMIIIENNNSVSATNTYENCNNFLQELSATDEFLKIFDQLFVLQVLNTINKRYINGNDWCSIQNLNSRKPFITDLNIESSDFISKDFVSSLYEACKYVKKKTIILYWLDGNSPTYSTQKKKLFINEDVNKENEITLLINLLLEKEIKLFPILSDKEKYNFEILSKLSEKTNGNCLINDISDISNMSRILLLKMVGIECDFSENVYEVVVVFNFLPHLYLDVVFKESNQVVLFKPNIKRIK